VLLLRLIIGGLVGWICGWIAGVVLCVPIWIVQLPSSDAAASRAWKNSKTISFQYLPIIGIAVGFGFALMYQHEVDVEARKKREAEAAAQEADERARREAVQRALASLRRLISEAQNAALLLPIVLAQAEAHMDDAEHELQDHCYSPFWEAMESATTKLNSFDQSVKMIEDRRTLYATQAAAIEVRTPAFSLGIAVLPDPAPSHRRLRTLYRQAQRNPDFANIYEQRRIALKIDQTNAILMAGFSSLGQAIEHLGDRTVDAISRLGAAIDAQLGSLQASLESTVTAAAEQHKALLAEVSRSGHNQTQALQELREDAERRADHERSALRMLDNIQHHRKPSFWDSSQ
jgi:hypothetical protein